MSYSYETMCKLNHRLSKMELSKQLGISRTTLDKYLEQFEQDKATRIELSTHKRLVKALGVLIPSYNISQIINLAESGKYQLTLEDLHPRAQLNDIKEL